MPRNQGCGEGRIQKAITKNGLRAGFELTDRSTFLWLLVEGYDSGTGNARVCEPKETCTDHEANQFQEWLGTGELVERQCFVVGGPSYVLVTVP